MKIYPYVKDAAEKVSDFLVSSPEGRHPLISMPTGTGKSVVIAEMFRLLNLHNSSCRALMLTHRKTLIEQNFKKLVSLWPTVPAGIHSAGINRRDTKQRFIFAGVQSIVNRLDHFAPVDYILVDEAHLVGGEEASQYVKVLKHFQEINGNARIIGLSATPYRTDCGHLLDSWLFTDSVIDYTTKEWFSYFVKEGYMAPLRAVASQTYLDADGVKTSGANGDYVRGALERKLNTEELTKPVCDEVARIGREYGRTRWLIFATGIAHVDALTAELRGMGLDIRPIHSKLDKETHDKNFRDFKAGKCLGAVSCDELTTGVDVPEIDYIVSARPTKASAVFVQMIGRGTRPAPGKEYTLVADFTDNTERLGPIDDPIIPDPLSKGKKKKKGPPPLKICDGCRTYVPINARECPHCGHLFETDAKINTRSSGVVIMGEGGGVPVKSVHVSAMNVRMHMKNNKRILRIMYTIYDNEYAIHKVNEFVCVEHEGFAGMMAKKWWQKRVGTPFPYGDFKRALKEASESKVPKKLFLSQNAKYAKYYNVLRVEM